MKRIIIFVALFMFCRLVYADTVYLKNGRHIKGLIKSEDNSGIELEVAGGSVKLNKSEIARIEKSGREESARIRQNMEKEQQDSQERMKNRIRDKEREPKDVEFSRDSGGMLLKATLNDSIDATLVLDTGASIIMLKRDVAQNLGINLDNAKPEMMMTVADGRQVPAKRVVLNSVKVQDSEAYNVEAAVLLEEYGGPGMHDGLLGMSFLKNFKFTIDHKENKLVLEKL
jgi:clan AA aspartic protease (TIGR02281 family)